MKRGLVLLLILPAGCIKKSNSVEAEPIAAILDEVCGIESNRHGDVSFHSDILRFGNAAMDRYEAVPRPVPPRGQHPSWSEEQIQQRVKEIFLHAAS